MTASEHNGIVETTGTETPDMLASLAEIGCVAHRDDLANCDRGASGRTWRAQGDLWCKTAYDEYGSYDGPPVGDIAFLDVDPTWVRDNVGLN